MLATVITVVATHDLAIGMLVGVLLSGVFFAGKVAQLVHVSVRRDEATHQVTYIITGQIFFASTEVFLRGFDFDEPYREVLIDVRAAHFSDITAIGALDKAVLKFRRIGARVEIVGLNEASATMVDRFATHDKEMQTEPMHAVFVGRAHLPARVGVFVDYPVERLRLSRSSDRQLHGIIPCLPIPSVA